MKPDTLDLAPFELPYDLDGQCRVLAARSTAARRAAVVRKARLNSAATPDSPGPRRGRKSEDGSCNNLTGGGRTGETPRVNRPVESSSAGSFEGVLL